MNTDVCSKFPTFTMLEFTFVFNIFSNAFLSIPIFIDFENSNSELRIYPSKIHSTLTVLYDLILTLSNLKVLIVSIKLSTCLLFTNSFSSVNFVPSFLDTICKLV